jgi:uncharacterized protein YneF (UPF0154 family)
MVASITCVICFLVGVAAGWLLAFHFMELIDDQDMPDGK